MAECIHIRVCSAVKVTASTFTRSIKILTTDQTEIATDNDFNVTVAALSLIVGCNVVQDANVSVDHPRVLGGLDSSQVLDHVEHSLTTVPAAARCHTVDTARRQMTEMCRNKFIRDLTLDAGQTAYTSQ